MVGKKNCPPYILLILAQGLKRDVWYYKPRHAKELNIRF